MGYWYAFSRGDMVRNLEYEAELKTFFAKCNEIDEAIADRKAAVAVANYQRALEQEGQP